MTKSGVLSILLGVVLLAFAVIAAAQQPAREAPRIGILFIGDRNQPHLEAFKQGLRERGYIEGKNIAIEYRYAEGKINRLPLLAAELVKLKVEVIVTTAEIGARAARQATKTTPIVLTTGADLVKSGLAESLAKPGGNVTGLSVLEEDLSGKRLDILKEAFPKMNRVAYLWNPSAVPYPLEHGTTTTANPSFDQAKAIAQAVALQLRSYEVYTLAEIEKAFADMSKARPDALFVILSPLMTLNSKRIVELALEQRLPGMYPTNQFAEEGGLMTYGPRIGDMYRRAATYVDKVLKGAKAGDLPVEQPTKFEFVINLKTAKQIGVTIPPNVLARADKVIK
ncbi:MAG TPA: ABC transporter substrate-binding protein [Candidatus Binatia bacterium]|jgi:putative ABC transport system substrate-binding protein|nr:ABC transporter substrate-binding protein [Candidatus Binatia bacterium]